MLDTVLRMTEALGINLADVIVAANKRVDLRKIAPTCRKSDPLGSLVHH